MELAVKRMFLGVLNSGVQAVRGGQEDRRGAGQRESHDCGRSRAGRRRAGRSYCSPALTRVTSALAAANHFDHLLWLLIGKESNCCQCSEESLVSEEGFSN